MNEKMNIKINAKRANLELFTREQIIGPGAFNKRYFMLTEWYRNEFQGKKIEECTAFENIHEVISEVPAYQYSSAILFPIAIDADEVQSDNGDDDEGDQDQVNAEEEDSFGEEGENSKADDENFKDYHIENTSSKNQNYPNTCGISFSINNHVNFERDLKFRLRFRTYRRVKADECRERKLGYWIPKNQKEIAQLVSEHLSTVFATETLDGNLFIYVKPNVNVTEHLHDIDYKYLEEVRIRHLVPRITSAFPDEELFKRSTRRFRDVATEYTRIYEDTLFSLISRRIRATKTVGIYRDLIYWLEIYNQLKNAVTDLKTIYRQPSARSKPTPIYEATPFDEKISFPALASNRRIIRDHITIKDSPSLWVYYQYMPGKAGSETAFIKIILVNKATIKLKRNEPPQLNKKNEANEKAFFGVALEVSEKTKGTFVPYNPPNLLSFDEEQSFMKLIYRRYEDFGEGYNTSVDWGTSSEELKFVATEFIPSQDVPKVDHRPSRLFGGKVESRIDEKLLEFRRHSTLSTITDDELRAELHSLAVKYKEWIREKSDELSVTDITQGKDILERQLKSCAVDQERIERNIRLLADDDNAIAAYRVMNTAMFMQLHHSKKTREKVKNNSNPYVPTENSEDYYRSLVLSEEYQWRTFQIAFILLNIDAFVRPKPEDKLVKDVFGTGWPERNELADLVWFPTGGGKTEAYLGLIAFCIAYRRFTKGRLGNGTAVLMRYTLRLLTLQQFQRASLLICALEVMRKEKFSVPFNLSLGDARITIGLFVGRESSPNQWKGGEKTMSLELSAIQRQLEDGKEVATKLPHTDCPWCGGALFIDAALANVLPKPDEPYNIADSLRITCNTVGCAFHHDRPLIPDKTLPFRLFDEDVYKFPPTLLFGTVDKFAALANKVSTATNDRNADSRRLFGKGTARTIDNLPPELIIQDELHLLLGPLGSAVGLFEKAIDSLCTYRDSKGHQVRPKIITSTATTRNTDKQIFALFERRSEIFPKQGIECDDSFFSFYERKENSHSEFQSDRRYLGLLPSGKTQVWMQLRIASIVMTHRLKYMADNFSVYAMIAGEPQPDDEEVFDYYETILAYFNSLKEVGKTQSQLGHYLPGDVNIITGNVLPWSFLDYLIRQPDEISWGELTGRLSGEKVKTSMKKIESPWKFLDENAPPEFVIATNMISVGIDISRLNVMIVNSMPRNTAEYIQASSRVARKQKGIVFTVHHPFRSRDISHYQRFKEFHEKFYGFIEPISVTPFASKALDRYLAMYIAVFVRHNFHLLANNTQALNIDQTKAQEIKDRIEHEMRRVRTNARALNAHLSTRAVGQKSNLDGIIGEEEFNDLLDKSTTLLFDQWLSRRNNLENPNEFVYRDDDRSDISLFYPGKALPEEEGNWNVKFSLREIAPSVVIKTVQQ
ncbi:MAG TPA: helicase-related protein [Cyclobacteriaceae bacterium]|jgi:hypothetical protein|nr:helicase-related protein [Cyclobacteriaceae bacterium]